MREPPAPEPETSLEARRTEIEDKLDSLRRLMRTHDLEAVSLSTTPNVCWLTAGATTIIDESSEQASFSALITARDAYIVTDPIEEPRLREEERLDTLGFSFGLEPWIAPERARSHLRAGIRLGTDVAGDQTSHDFQRALVSLRATLRPGEQARLRSGARRATAVVEGVARALLPGMTEIEAAAQLAAASRLAGGSAIVTLVGSDERVARFRHPIPTARPIERYVMLVLCLRYRGLVTALTRFVHFGESPDTLLKTAEEVARVDAAMIAGTQPGLTLAEIYSLAARAYASAGQPDAIQEHHQGGPIAYRSREAFATPTSDWRIATGQAFAWNPSLRGSKSEDTILLTPNGHEIVTRSPDWPIWTFETPTGPIQRPAILNLPG